jgi:hypothetical protein
MGLPHRRLLKLKEREMTELFVGCMHCGFIAGKHDGYVASWRWCPECGMKLREMGPGDIDLIAKGGEGKPSGPIQPPEIRGEGPRPNF